MVIHRKHKGSLRRNMYQFIMVTQQFISQFSAVQLRNPKISDKKKTFRHIRGRRGKLLKQSSGSPMQGRCYMMMDEGRNHYNVAKDLKRMDMEGNKGKISVFYNIN